MKTLHPTHLTPSQDEFSTWPNEVQSLINSLEHVFPPVLQRRKLPRAIYKRQGTLQIADHHPVPIYTRDCNQWTVGLITPTPLHSNDRGILRLTAPDGSTHELHIRVIRSREITPEWFDAAVEFPTDDSFADYNIPQ